MYIQSGIGLVAWCLNSWTAAKQRTFMPAPLRVNLFIGASGVAGRVYAHALLGVFAVSNRMVLHVPGCSQGRPGECAGSPGHWGFGPAEHPGLQAELRRQAAGRAACTCGISLCARMRHLKP